jgi:hypothetical protein
LDEKRGKINSGEIRNFEKMGKIVMIYLAFFDNFAYNNSVKNYIFF